MGVIYVFPLTSSVRLMAVVRCSNLGFDQNNVSLICSTFSVFGNDFKNSFFTLLLGTQELENTVPYIYIYIYIYIVGWVAQSV